MKKEIEGQQLAFKTIMQLEVKNLDLLFDTIYNKLYRSSFRYGINILNNVFIIENIVQDAFLKLWNFRETITSIEHASRFLKQTVRWECYNYFRSPEGRFYRHLNTLETVSDDGLTSGYSEAEEKADDADRQLKVINSMLRFLPSGKEKSWLKLYYYDGLTHMQIATRYNVSVTEVCNGLTNVTSKIKTMVVRPGFFAHKSQEQPYSVASKFTIHQVDGLNSEQSVIYRLRTESKHEFGNIASHLGLSLSYVQQQYVQAWKIINAQKSMSSNRVSRFEMKISLSA